MSIGVDAAPSRGGEEPVRAKIQDAARLGRNIPHRRPSLPWASMGSLEYR